MPFQKGNKYGRGKPKGAKNKKTRIVENLMDSLVDDGADRFKKVINDSDDKEFIKIYMELLEYSLPKYARREYESHKEQENQTVTIEIVDRINED